MIDGHGDDIYKCGTEIKYNFSSNIYQGFNYDGLIKQLSGSKQLLSIYPEPYPYSLENIIIEKLGVKKENLIITAGSTDSIYMIALAFRGKKSAIIEPTFSEYEDACRINEHEVIYLHKHDIEDAKVIDCDLLWICNPNNPTGSYIPECELEKIIDKNKNIIFIIDCAYIYYTKTDFHTHIINWTKKSNVLLLFSLTKRFGVPGLRVGYVLGSEEIVGILKKYIIPWSISSTAIEGGKYLIEHSKEYHIPIDVLLKETKSVTSTLRDMGIKVYDSKTNFFLCELPFGNSKLLKEFLIREKGLLIRDASNFYGLNEKFFRVAVQSKEANKNLTEGIAEWISLYQ